MASPPITIRKGRRERQGQFSRGQGWGLRGFILLPSPFPTVHLPHGGGGDGERPCQKSCKEKDKRRREVTAIDQSADCVLS